MLKPRVFSNNTLINFCRDETEKLIELLIEINSDFDENEIAGCSESVAKNVWTDILKINKIQIRI